MKNWIQNIEEKAGEFFSSHVILICGVLVVVTGAICVTGHGGSWLTPCGAIVGACIAMYQWASDRRVKRSELLNELVTRFSKFDIEKMIHPSDDPDRTVTEPYRAVSEDEGMFDLLTFLSYVCHLYRSYVISKREFSSLQWDIVKVLESDLVYPPLSRFLRDNLSRIFTKPLKTLDEKYFRAGPKPVETFRPSRPGLRPRHKNRRRGGCCAAETTRARRGSTGERSFS